MTRDKSHKSTILVLMGGYWPGHDATGPNKSLRQLCAALAAEFHFKIVARDRPFGARDPMVPTGCWIDLGYAEIRYCKVSPLGAHHLGKILRTTPHDVVAMNGFFDREFTIPALFLRKLGLVPRKPAVLSTRGEMGSGALRLKSARKVAHLAISRRCGLLRDVWLHATAPQEALDIAERLPWARAPLLAPIVPGLGDVPAARAQGANAGSRRRLVFVGRIARMKNLDFALRVLCSVRAPVDFNIYGPVSEPDYWAECCNIIEQLPRHVCVTHRGEIPNADVPAELAAADLLFMPSRGENFGHAIFEALSCGLPVLISDRTPWQDLEERGAGWSLPLDRPEAFATAVERLAAMSADARIAMRRGARGLAERYVVESDAVEANRRLFATVLAGTRREFELPAGRAAARFEGAR